MHSSLLRGKVDFGIRARGENGSFRGGEMKRRGRGTENEFHLCGVDANVPVHDCEGGRYGAGVG